MEKDRKDIKISQVRKVRKVSIVRKVRRVRKGRIVMKGYKEKFHNACLFYTACPPFGHCLYRWLIM